MAVSQDDPGIRGATRKTPRKWPLFGTQITGNMSPLGLIWIFPAKKLLWEKKEESGMAESCNKNRNSFFSKIVPPLWFTKNVLSRGMEWDVYVSI